MTDTFVPKPEEAWYYKIPKPHLRESVLHTCFVQPWSPPDDRSHGRLYLPFSPREQRLRDNKSYEIWDRRVFLNDDKSEWLFYQVWEDKAASAKRTRQADLIYLHGISDYGGKFSEHAEPFLKAGYRLVIPDLVAHGRSTGLHAYVTSMESLEQGVDAVICDVAKLDRKKGASDEEINSRRRFIAGASMGGFTALFYTIQYPSEPASEAAETGGIRSGAGGLYRPPIDGALFLCPMIEISPHSRPSMFVEYIARALSKVAGRLPLAAANKGKNSDDPMVEQEFEMDPQGYSGKLRIATGLACLQGLISLNERLEEVKIPFKVFHGTSDRVTSHRGSQNLYDRCSSRDKEIQLYDGLHHVMLRVGRDADDDAPRQQILKDMLEWLQARSS